MKTDAEVMKYKCALHRMVGVFEGLSCIMETHKRLPPRARLQNWAKKQQEYLEEVLDDDNE